MKRDWGCVRAVLLAIEEEARSGKPVHPARVSGWDVETVCYHVRLLEQGGLVVAASRRMGLMPDLCLALGLSWEGHELLDSIRTPAAWNRIVAFAKDAELELSFEALRATASVTVRQVIVERAS